MYKVQKGHAFYYSLSIIKFSGFYPYFKNEALALIHVSATMGVFSLPWLVLMLAHLGTNIKERTYYRLAEDLADISADVGCHLCCFFFGVHHKKWSKLFTELTSFKEFGKPPNFDKVVKKYSYLAVIFYIYVTSTIVIYTLVSLADMPDCNRRNKELNLHEICGLFTPIWWPKGKEMSNTVYIWFTVSQVTCSQVFLPLMMVIPGLCIEAVELIIIRIDHLDILINDIFDRPGDLKTQMRKMNHWIRYHQHIINQTNGYTVGLGALVLACINIQIQTESLPKGYLFALGYCVILFTVCHSGQRLFDGTEKLALVVFNTKWYNSPVKVQKWLPFIIARCQKPSKIDAIPVGKVGYSLFLLMIKTSYSYVTFMDASINKSIK